MLALLVLLTCCSFVFADFALQPIGLLRQNEADNLDSVPHRQLTALVQDPQCTAYTMSVPVDHFKNESRYEQHSDDTFRMRYFLDTRYYKPGGPVIVLQSGEADAALRCPYLYSGIINILTKATNGLGIIVEHRYYGQSIPVTNYTVENLRFLTTEQAMADMAYFAQRFRLPDQGDLSPSKVPWIVYGGSYAGALAAFVRKIYPDIFWGAIGSSAVTQAIWDYGYYFTPIAKHADQKCVLATETNVNIVDSVLQSNDTRAAKTLKSWFGLGDLAYDTDFVNALTYGPGSWQKRNWDPNVTSDDFDNYCSLITNPKGAQPSEAPPDLEKWVSHAGYNSAAIAPMLNLAEYARKKVVGIAGKSPIGTFYNNHNPFFYLQTSLTAGVWRPWPWQYCTEWGFLQTGTVTPGVPRLVSRLLTAEYMSLKCQLAFNLSKPADTDRVNKFGGAKISYPRLAFVDGSADAWLGATPHGPLGGSRKDTTDQPSILIKGAVHHWDENGLASQGNFSDPKFQQDNVFGDGPADDSLPPPVVQDAQFQLVKAVTAWVEQFRVANVSVASTSINSNSSDDANGTFGANQPGGSGDTRLPVSAIEPPTNSGEPPAGSDAGISLVNATANAVGKESYTTGFTIGEAGLNRKRAMALPWLRHRVFRLRRRLDGEEGSSEWWPW